MEDESTLLCHLVSDFKNGPPARSFVDTCRDCKRAVWHAYSSPSAKIVVCMACGYQRFIKEQDAKMEPPTNEQIDEMIAYYEENDD